MEQQEIYRNVALERLSTPEQLDTLLHVTSSRAWLAVAMCGFVLLAAVVWGVLGSLSQSAAVEGILAPIDGTTSVVADRAGIVSALLVQPGQQVQADQPVAHISTGRDGDPAAVQTSPRGGQVAGIVVAEGDAVGIGDTLVTVQTPRAPLEAVLYAPVALGKQLRPGAEVHITPATVQQQDFGFLIGHVDRVSPSVLSSRAMLRDLGSDRLVAHLTQAADGMPVQVRVALASDAAFPAAYHWSSGRQPPTPLSAGTPVAATVTLREIRPIALIFPVLDRPIEPTVPTGA